MSAATYSKQVLEFALLGAGLWLYTRRTTARDKVGRYGLLGLVVFLVLVHVGSLLSPPPTSVGALGWVGTVVLANRAAGLLSGPPPGG
ncbi:MAG: hypothetical protein EOO55_02105 [Hymenobacter sp.]|nr:MAG: hypothetical protein EOO55_02105 [Hymenobacter sp.]